MSTSVLYHCFGVMGRGIHHSHTRFEKGRTVFKINQVPTTFQCSHCGSRAVKKKGTVRRMWITLPVGLRPTLIEWLTFRAFLWGFEGVFHFRVVSWA